MKILGIDPGSVSGAYALVQPGPPGKPSVLRVGDLPGVAGQVNAAELARLVREFAPDHAIVERVSAMPKQGVSSTFKFGQAYGAIMGVLATLEVPIKLVVPTVWKGHFRLNGKDKEDGRALAIRMWPSCPDLGRKKDHNRADAALIAQWGLEALTPEPPLLFAYASTSS